MNFYVRSPNLICIKIEGRKRKRERERESELRVSNIDLFNINMI